MFVLSLIMELRGVRAAFARAQELRAARDLAVAVATEMVTTQAAGYGFEIGKGQPLKTIVKTSPDNPFLNSNWRSQVIKND